MGAFYGSIHVRTDDRADVLAATAALAHKQKLRFLVAPVLRGWVGIYPSGQGQDQRITRALARKLDYDVIGTLVHDDDFFCYDFYRRGKLIDQYNSLPDYFDSESAAKKQKLCGRPEMLIDLLPHPKRLQALKKLLAADRADRPVFATDLLVRFAELLDLPNAVTAYEYLMCDETDEIEQWDSFTHVPDLTAEKAKQAAVVADHAALMKRWREQGVLLLHETRSAKSFAGSMPWWVADDAGGFFMLWADGMTKALCSLDHYQSPWTLPAERVGIELESTVYCLNRSPSGRYLAAGHASGNWKACLWDLVQRSHILDVDHARAVSWVGFSPDEKLFISLGSEDGLITSIDSRQRVAALAVQHAKLGVVHLSGTLVVSDQIGRVHLVDLPSGTTRQSLTLGSREQFETRRKFQLAAMKQAYANFDEDMLEKSLQAQLDQIDGMVEQFRKNVARLGQGDVEGQAQKFKEQILKSIEDTRARFAEQRRQIETGDLPVHGAETAMCIDTSRDGRWLFVGTSHGIRVYEWPAVAAARDFMPEPALRVDSAGVPREVEPGVVTTVSSGYIYGLAIDDARQRLIFGGLAGRIESLDLTTGRHSILREMPGHPPILRLGLSANASALMSCTYPGMFDQGRQRRPAELLVWNCQAL